MNLFYVDNIQADTAQLSETESRHCIKAMRMRQGDRIQLCDGNGHLYTGIIVDDNPKGCLLSLQDKKVMPPAFPYQLHIAVAATKNADRIEWFVEKAVEIGITEISCICCVRSERTHINTERFERLITSAMKQSLHYHRPAFHAPVQVTALMRQYAARTDWQRFIAYCGEESSVKELQAVAEAGKNSLVLIGPEGDFEETEVQTAIQCGFQTVTLGNMRLRTETAALVACCQLHFINNRHSK